MNLYILILIIVIIILILATFTHIIDNFSNQWNDKIDGIVYINLDKREDRKKLLLNELAKVEIDISKVNKVSGIYTPKNGHKGCVQSHILALNIAKLNKWKHILIFEDDMELNVSPDEFNTTINKALDYMSSNNVKWDVIMLATGWNEKTPINAKIGNNDLAKIISATTGSGYIVNSKYYDTLLDLYIYCNNNMTKNKWSGGTDWEPYALDQQWIKYQQRDNWYGFTNDLIRQRNISSTTMNRE